MKKVFSILTGVFLFVASQINTVAQTNKNQTIKSKKMETVKQSKEVVQEFFTAFGGGDLSGINNLFNDSCIITSIRADDTRDDQIYGTYRGKDGAKMFITKLVNTFNTKSFSVDNIISEGNIAFANGKFTHIIKSTGKYFSSDWALMCLIKDDKILEYHFYEDSQKFIEAIK